MKRLVVGAAAVVVASITISSASVAGATAPPRTQLRSFGCQRALDPANRSVSVTAVMRPVTGTEHMALRFDLLGSTPTSVARPVKAGDLGVWISPSNPTLGQLPGDVWNLQKSVVSLAAPARYRFKVDFRWTGSHGQLLGNAVRYSARCKQVELRPDLAVTSITVTPIAGQPNYDLYTAQVANNGNSGAGPFDVMFASADGATVKTHTIRFLRARATTTEAFAGPVCTSTSDPTITADSASEIDDLNRANNSLQATCPAAASGGSTGPSASPAPLH